MSIARSYRRRENYKLVKEFMVDLKDENTDQFLIQSGFLAVGGSLLPVGEIKYLLSKNNPYSVIDLKSSSESFVFFDEVNLSYSWRKFYKTRLMKKLGVTFFNIIYALFITLAMLPHLGGEKVITFNFGWLFFSIVFVVLGLVALNFGDNFKQTKKFMKLVRN